MAFADFLINSVRQIPNAHRVLFHAVTTSWWVLILFAVFESLAAAFWWKARGFERALADENRRRWQRPPQR